MDYAVELIDICKKFGQVDANKNVSLSIENGSIHGIIGENGAGKSTLMSILYGFYRADRGKIKIQGKKINIKNPSVAISSGIGMVHQHFMLINTFSVIENIVLGVDEKKSLKSSFIKAKNIIKEFEKEFQLEVNLDSIVQDLPVGVLQRVEILKALYRGAEILILDEPTGVLTPQESDRIKGKQ